ncbi:unnamed protein product [Amoebophrya sp. A25]|nr:unnamed protein product [Amoebophrya sp. A25]|eukprot:GSA25T00024737001.1
MSTLPARLHALHRAAGADPNSLGALPDKFLRLLPELSRDIQCREALHGHHGHATPSSSATPSSTPTSSCPTRLVLQCGGASSSSKIPLSKMVPPRPSGFAVSTSRSSSGAKFPWEIEFALCLSAFAKSSKRPKHDFWRTVHEFSTQHVKKLPTRQLCLLCHAFASVQERSGGHLFEATGNTFFEAAAVELNFRSDMNDIDYATLLNSLTRVRLSIALRQNDSAIQALEALVKKRAPPRTARPLSNVCHAIARLEVRNQGRIVDDDRRSKRTF